MKLQYKKYVFLISALFFVNSLVSCIQKNSNPTHPTQQPLPQTPTTELGGVHGGGGDVTSDRIDNIVTLLGVSSDGKSAKIKEILLNALNINIEFSPNIFTDYQIFITSTDEIKHDILNSKYVLKQYCANQEGVEKSASTDKVNLQGKLTEQHPEVCINIRKLALENAKLAEIVGLLMHEHVRHFGLEDTDSLGRHPIALSFTKRYPLIEYLNLFKRKSTNFWIKEPLKSNKYVEGLDKNKTYVNLAVMTNTPDEIGLRIKAIKGSCDLRLQTADPVPGTIEIANIKNGEDKFLKISEIESDHPFLGIKTSSNCEIEVTLESNTEKLYNTLLIVDSNSLIGYRIGFYKFPDFQEL